MIRTVFFMAYVMLLMHSCDTPKPASGGGSKGLPLASQWILHYFVEAGEVVYPATKTPQFTIDENLATLGGHGGCNSFGGKVHVAQQRIKFSDLYATEMACDELATEQKFFQKLEETDAYEIKGGEMFLKRGGKTIMVMESFRR